jgi:succinate-acetate transporter protein
MRASPEARVVLTPIATPLPLTFLGLTIATLLLTGLELGWIPKNELHLAGWALLGVPFPLQLIAAVFGFHGRSATAATGSSVLAAAWIGISLDLIHAPLRSFAPSHAVGMLCLGAALGLLVPAASDLRAGSPLPAAILAAASVRFLLTAIAGLAASSGVRTVAGIVGIAVAALAFYGALAFELEDNSIEDTLLPTFRRRQSAEALHAALDRQVEQLEHEAGIRKNL